MHYESTSLSQVAASQPISSTATSAGRDPEVGPLLEKRGLK
jgi:hypothetical protein